MSSGAREIQLRELHDSIREMQRDIRSLKVRLEESEAGRQADLEKYQQEKAALEKDNRNLQEQVDYLKKKLFGRSSEKDSDIPGQLNLFNEAEASPEPSPVQLAQEAEAASQAGSGRRKPRATFMEKFKGIPVRKVFLDIPEDERSCPRCGYPMSKMGETFVRREFNYIPGRGEIIEYYSVNYECENCKKNHPAPTLVRGKDGKAHMLYGMVSSGTVAWIMYQKYVNAMPLYRQEADFKRNGIQLDRATLANWVIKNAEAYFIPVYNYLHYLIIQRGFAMADETPCQVLHEPGRKAKTKSYMWVFRSGEDGGPPIVLYKYSETRNGDNAMDFLKGFTGYLMTDGFAGYNKVKNVRRCACWAHIRRYLIDAIPKGKKDDYTLPAVQGYLYVEKLFAIEKSIKEKHKGDFDNIKKERLKREKPVIEAFLSWLDVQNPVKGSRFDTAVTYIRNRQPYLQTYLEDGRCSLSNNWSENSIRPLVIGRKNYLFSDTPKGANASAAIYTIAELARVNGVNIYHYLEYLLDKCPVMGTSYKEIEALMPWNEDVKAEINHRVVKGMAG